MTEPFLEDLDFDPPDSKEPTKVPLPTNQIRRFRSRQTLGAIVPNDHNRGWSDEDDLDSIVAFALRSPNGNFNCFDCVTETTQDGWVQIISDQVLEEINEETAKASISFQVQQKALSQKGGWGIFGGQSLKQQLRIQILSDGDESVVSNTIIDCNSYHRDNGLVEMSFDSDHDIIRECKMGRTFVIGIKDSATVEEEFLISNLEFKIESAPSIRELKRREYLGRNIKDIEKSLTKQRDNFLCIPKETCIV